MDNQQRFVIFLTLLWMPTRVENSALLSVSSSYDTSCSPVLSSNLSCTSTGESTTTASTGAPSNSQGCRSMTIKCLTILETTALRSSALNGTHEATSQTKAVSSQGNHDLTHHSAISSIVASSKTSEIGRTFSPSFILTRRASFDSGANRSIYTSDNVISTINFSRGTTSIGSSAYQGSDTLVNMITTSKSSRGATSIGSSANDSINTPVNIISTTKSLRSTTDISSSAYQDNNRSNNVIATTKSLPSTTRIGSSYTSDKTSPTTESSDLESSSQHMTSSYTGEEATPINSTTITFLTKFLNATSTSSISSHSINATKSQSTSKTSKTCWGQTNQECNSSSRVQITNIAWYYGIVCTLTLCFGQIF